MTPTTRSNPRSASSRARASVSKSPQTRRRPELSYAESNLGAKERTKRGCWTCRIRRKKCDEEQVDGSCNTCRRLELECLGWGTKRAEWMKDKKCVDQRLANIKQQLARQGKIRGQPRSHTVLPGPSQQRLERSPTSSDSPSLSNSHYSTNTLVATSPSSTYSSLATRQKRHSDATNKAQGTDRQPTHPSVYLDSPTPGASSEASGDEYIDQEDQFDQDEDAYGSDDIDYENEGSFGWHSFEADEDCEMTPHSDNGLDVPAMFGRPGSNSSRSASPSFVNSPLHAGASFPDADSGFTTSFTIHGLGGNGMHDPTSSLTGALGNTVNPGSTDALHPGIDNAFADMDMSHFSYMFPSVPAAAFNTLSQPPHMDMSTSRQHQQASTGGISPALMTPPVGTEQHGQPSGTSPSPTTVLQSLGITVTTPAGMTRSAAGFNVAPSTSHSSHDASNGFPAPAGSYFPQQPLTRSPPSRASGTPSTAGVPSGPAAPATSRSPGQQANGTQPTAGAAYGTFTMSYRPQIRNSLSDPTRTLSTFQETLVFYYFNRGVRRMQYLLADDSTTGVTDVMYDLVIRDPLGPVTNAICSLAALHDTRLRIAHGLVHPEDPHAHESAQKLYDDTVRQLSRRERRFTEVEAIASLHLLSFWLFCGGGGAWDSALTMAGDWLKESEVMADNIADPIEIIERWSPTKRFAAQAILWFDILGSCSVNRSPRFLKLYRRMSHRNRTLRSAGNQATGGLFNNQRRASGSQSELMNQVMGCDDDVMFALAEIADLAAWKQRRIQAGTLSNRELVDRCRGVEELLASTRVVVSPLSPTGGNDSQSRSSTGLLSPTEGSFPTFPQPPPQHIPAVWDPYNVNSLPMTSNSGSSSDASQGTMSSSSRASPAVQPIQTPLPPIPSDPSASVTGAPGPLSIVTTAEPVTLRQLSSNVFREAAFLYLHTVESGPHPAVREIRRSVQALADSILAIPSHDLDRSLAFPITIGGCLAETPEHRDFFSSRLAMQGTAVGNGSQAKLLMEAVWQVRDGGERGVDWRNTMEKLGFELLLV